MQPDADGAFDLGEPYDLEATLRRTALWGSDPTIRFGGRAHPGEVFVAMRLPAGPAAVHYQLESAGRVVARAFGAGAREAVEQAPAHLGAGDPSVDYVHAHPVVGPLLRRARGTRFGKTLRVWDHLVAVVFGQKVSSTQASMSYRALVHEHGEPAPGPLELMVPPSAARVKELDYTHFHTVNVERRRAEVLLSLSRRAARLESLTSLEPGEAEAKLLTLPGIGPWTAAHVIGKAMGWTDAVPVGDWSIPHHVAATLTGAARSTDEEMLGLLEPFRPHRARAMHAILSGGASAPRYGPKMALRDFRRQ